MMLYSRLVLAALGGCGLLCAPVGVAAENVLPNPGFEAGAEGWHILPEDGEMSTVGASAAASGLKGLRVKDESVKYGSSVRSDWVAVAPGETWQVDFLAKVVSGNGIGVYLQFAGADKKTLRPQVGEKEVLRTVPPNQGGWALYHLAATVPEGAAYVSIWVHSFAGSKVEAYFDDFVLRKVPAQSAVLFPTSAGGSYKAFQLPEFPKLDAVDFGVQMKVLQPDGSAYRTPQEDWQGARERIAGEAQWQEWFDKEKARLDGWIARNSDRAEWEAGWNHEFIDPQNGAWLVWTEAVPGEEVDHIVSTRGDKVAITPTLFRSWVGAFRKNHSLAMGDVARLYRLTENEAYAEWVAAQLDFYADNYEGWGSGVAQRKGSWLGYQSLDDAVVVSRLVEAARLIHDWAAPERRQKWFTKLFRPEAELLDRTMQNIHNIALWQRATQAQIGLLYEDDAIFQRAMYGPNGVAAQFSRGVSSDYFWYEQSQGYNDFIMMGSVPLFTFAGLVGKGDLVKEQAEVAQNLMIAPLLIRFADNRLPNPADNGGTPRAPSGWLERTYRILPTTYGLAKAAGGYSWNTLIDPPNAAQASLDLPPVTSIKMESIQFAVMKDANWQVFFHYGQLAASHAQSEALNWSATFKGKLIAYDPGTVGYGSERHGEYYTRGAAHNVPLIDGEGQAYWEPGKLTEFNEATKTMTAIQPNYWRRGKKGIPWRWGSAPQGLQDGVGAEASRQLQIVDDALIERTHVELGQGRKAQLGLALHLLGTPRLGEAFSPVDAAEFASGRSTPFKYWEKVKVGAFSDRVRIPVDFGDGIVLDVLFESEGKFHLYQATTPYFAGQTRQSFYLEQEAPANSADFTVTLQSTAAD